VTWGLLVENRAASQLRFGRPKAALAALAEAERLVLARPGRIQQYAVLLAHRAEALVRDRQVADGCQAAVDALAIAVPMATAWPPSRSIASGASGWPATGATYRPSATWRSCYGSPAGRGQLHRPGSRRAQRVRRRRVVRVAA